MDMNEMMTTARDAMTVRRVFGEPVSQDDVTVIPAAVVVGGMGGGTGQGAGGEVGDGGGFGLIAMPVGVFRIAQGQVRWHPAVNANLLIAAATAVTVTYLATRSRITRARLKSTAR